MSEILTTVIEPENSSMSFSEWATHKGYIELFTPENVRMFPTAFLAQLAEEKKFIEEDHNILS